MIKYLLALVWLFNSPALRRLLGKAAKESESPAAPRTAKPNQETMVRCSHCGVHLPEGDAVTNAQGEFFCDPAHRQAGAAPS